MPFSEDHDKEQAIAENYTLLFPLVHSQGYYTIDI